MPYNTLQYDPYATQEPPQQQDEYCTVPNDSGLCRDYEER